jgi:hypothetical protein
MSNTSNLSWDPAPGRRVLPLSEKLMKYYIMLGVMSALIVVLSMINL